MYLISYFGDTSPCCSRMRHACSTFNIHTQIFSFPTIPSITPMRRVKHSRGSSKGTFNPDDAQHVKHTKFGVWDFYQERSKLAHIPGAAKAEPYLEMYQEIYQSLPFVWRMLKELGQIRSCWTMLFIYLLVVLLASLVPAVSLWYSGQLLKIVRQHISLK
jgi:hypothetical protein